MKIVCWAMVHDAEFRVQGVVHRMTAKHTSVLALVRICFHIDFMHALVQIGCCTSLSAYSSAFSTYDSPRPEVKRHVGRG